MNSAQYRRQMQENYNDARRWLRSVARNLWWAREELAREIHLARETRTRFTGPSDLVRTHLRLAADAWAMFQLTRKWGRDERREMHNMVRYEEQCRTQDRDWQEYLAGRARACGADRELGLR